MTAEIVLNNILDNDNLFEYPFKYCLVDKSKRPYKLDGTLAKPNEPNDFCSIGELLKNMETLKSYSGLGISIQASKISAIDVDHCFAKPFDVTSINEIGQKILDLFMGKTYCEFSFSGTGMRIFFVAKPIENYSEKYYIKNDKTRCEYYQPSESARYVTITGKPISDFSIYGDISKELEEFLQTYMLRTIVKKSTVNQEIIEDNRDIEDLLKRVKGICLMDYHFQSLWYNTHHDTDASGSSLESQRDYAIIHTIYDKVTKDKSKIKEIFESSPYFKSKDKKHMYKWEYNNYRYFNYVYSVL